MLFDNIKIRKNFFMRRYNQLKEISMLQCWFQIVIQKICICKIVLRSITYLQLTNQYLTTYQQKRYYITFFTSTDHLPRQDVSSFLQIFCAELSIWTRKFSFKIKCYWHFPRRYVINENYQYPFCCNNIVFMECTTQLKVLKEYLILRSVILSSN